MLPIVLRERSQMLMELSVFSGPEDSGYQYEVEVDPNYGSEQEKGIN